MSKVAETHLTWNFHVKYVQNRFDMEIPCQEWLKPLENHFDMDDMEMFDMELHVKFV